MHAPALGLLLAFLAQESRDLPSVPVSEYAARRARLMERLADGVIVLEAEKLLPGMSGIDANTPLFDFSYLAGYHAAGDILVLVPGEKKAFVFTTEKPDGVRKAAGDAHVFPHERFAPFAAEVLAAAKVIYTRARGAAMKALEDAAPNATFRGGDALRNNPIHVQLVRLRMIKSDVELKVMKRVADATNKAHLAAMRACRGGMNEKELQKVIEDTFTAEGMTGLGFPSIVGSGKNGTILHYMANKKEIPKESLVVCDIGASLHGYVTDITRTLPTDGKYTEEQRKAYQCVLDAQKAAEKILRPGATFGELEAEAQAVFEKRGLTKWSYAHSEDFSVRHGLGHYVGLSVHDSGTYKKFEPGCVVTIEPGYYDKDAGWGIRIEDIYLVTKDGFERWSAGAPREMDEIEKVMAGARK